MLSYRIFIWLYPKAVALAAFFNPKAKQWIRGREGIFERIQDELRNCNLPKIWMHTASLGEFEQGLPVLEQLRNSYPDHKIVLSFFSPSGYEIRKNHPAADHVFYLPMDSPPNARKFLDLVNPRLVLFVKYEFWYYYLNETHQRGIPLLLVSGIFRKKQAFFRWYGSTYRKMLSFFSVLFVQNRSSAELLAAIGLGKKTVLAGDTRFDRVLKIAGTFQGIPAIEHFCADKPVIVAGSNWTDDDEELDHFANTRQDIRFIIAPHDIGEDRLKECEKLYRHTVRYTVYAQMLQDGTLSAARQNANVLIIDNMGMLSRLYHYATIAYVGGGFGEEGIHNILEPAVFGKPVVFGPVYDKYFEAEEMLAENGAVTVSDALQLESVMASLLDNPDKLQRTGLAAGSYVKSRAGATKRIIGYIQANRLLIN
ncbi:3-deoxy-D-manno-octulosonic acid transferase [Sediminibacterium soli]|uniref:3-deoxy-D-manno-octulosonic acid transferase n=1 Tax=Sediminibacterium soli TaxID=2698829 RepID=UPI00137AC8F4|nr:glycosyltransferase N-terminal domain-containing protein [Sediminibacterium soli]NCI48151.1 3-deoxy-D-manno-octulosonic acid transferase [Sediminibacterium soli]